MKCFKLAFDGGVKHYIYISTLLLFKQLMGEDMKCNTEIPYITGAQITPGKVHWLDVFFHGISGLYVLKV